jgi:hypothetical protein
MYPLEIQLGEDEVKLEAIEMGMVDAAGPHGREAASYAYVIFLCKSVLKCLNKVGVSHVSTISSFPIIKVQ